MKRWQPRHPGKIPFPLSSRGIGTSSLSSWFDRALVVGDFSGSGGVDTIEGVNFQAPLCAVLTDGSSWVMETEEEKSLVEIRVREEVDEPEFDEARQKREVSNSSLDDSSLAKFSKSLGFTTEGVEGEILKLLLRLKNIRDQGKKRGTLGTTRFDREVKKLEC